MKKLLLLCFLSALTAACQTKQAAGLLEVHEIEYEGNINIQKVSNLLDREAVMHHVDVLNWEAFPYRPEVSFRIAYSEDAIWLKFYIREEHILAQRTETNSSTHRDSCLEFFFDPISEGPYYNFEVNAIGTVHLAYGPGPGKHQREFVEPDLIERQMQVYSTLGEEPFAEIDGDFNWELTMIIPAELLVHHKDLSLKGLRSKANFYKCGDDTSKPHYLSWNPVGTERPNFHTPEFFGTLVFK
ncbi:carbohydrate-binding family 9-like protein [Poritiphilus flavus]|uniref:Carbohydrate-binding domain-containing protein n=1 Tax=Poritiphilus flavus TaxID=2697053 RepID=A0A6L9E817_9FLAO|nr:carbohydrate-binding family 9-like protein [Poritiphilus flavus]NAS10752.1 hypothetical protein [Poritiphilus flavus]